MAFYSLNCFTHFLICIFKLTAEVIHSVSLYVLVSYIYVYIYIYNCENTLFGISRVSCTYIHLCHPSGYDIIFLVSRTSAFQKPIYLLPPFISLPQLQLDSSPCTPFTPIPFLLSHYSCFTPTSNRISLVSHRSIRKCPRLLYNDNS